MAFGIKERVFTKKEVVGMFANSLGQEKAIKEIDQVTQKLRFMSDVFTTPQVGLILEDLSLKGGIISTVARFMRSRLVEEFKQTESFLTDIINAMPSILIILDSDFNVIKWNRALEDTKHVNMTTIEQQSVFSLLPELYKHKDIFERSLTLKITSSIDKISINDDETKHYFRVMVYPLHTSGSLGLVLRMDDITEQIFLEDKMLQNEKLVSLGVLTAGIAHEINNPVNFITASITPLKNDIKDLIDIITIVGQITYENYQEKLKELQVLKQEIDFDTTLAEIDSLLNAIADGGQRVGLIVKDLRTFSRLDENALKEVNIEAGIESTVSLISHKAKGRVSIIKEYSKLPNIQCFPGKINQVIMNLISNAIDAIDDTGTVYISTESDDKYVYIKVKDTGKGIPQEVLPHIFEPFYTTKDVGAGTGLGLSISYSIIKDHNGYIDVKSVIGKGTEFIVALPSASSKAA